MFLASENIDFTGLAHVFLLGGGEVLSLFGEIEVSDLEQIIKILEFIDVIRYLLYIKLEIALSI